MENSYWRGGFQRIAPGCIIYSLINLDIVAPSPLPFLRNPTFGELFKSHDPFTTNYGFLSFAVVNVVTWLLLIFIIVIVEYGINKRKKIREIEQARKTDILRSYLALSFFALLQFALVLFALGTVYFLFIDILLRADFYKNFMIQNKEISTTIMWILVFIAFSIIVFLGRKLRK